MREILYFQAGNYTNYIGTHFWNTQESYLPDSPDSDPVISPEVPFREEERNGTVNYTPRLLIFDFKSNFGAFARSNIAPDVVGAAEEPPSLWGGHVLDIPQATIPESDYVKSLNEGLQDKPKQVRYWADFNRLFHSPDTLQAVPDRSEWSVAVPTWKEGQELFMQYDKERDLMENSVRRFLEECNSPQGLQALHDSAEFGGFTSSFLTQFHDDYPKMTVLTGSCMSVSPHDTEPESLRTIVQDAALLQSLEDLTNITIPFGPPSHWQSIDNVQVNLNDPYRTSAVLASHYESVTLPTRLFNDRNRVDLADFTLQLAYRAPSNARLTHLVGVAPSEDDELDFTKVYDYSSSKHLTVKDLQLARHDILRVSKRPQGYEKWTASCNLNGPSNCYDLPPFPLPTSFPSVFASSSASQKGSTPLFSSLVTTSATASSFASYAKACEKAIKSPTILEALDMSADEVRDLADEMWSKHDGLKNEEGD